MELSKRHRRIWIFLSILGAVIIVIIFPFDLVIAPERKLQILDNNGNPIANALVSQFWDQYSLGEHGEIRLTTNSEGRIILPKREVVLSNRPQGVSCYYFDAIHEFIKS